MNILVQNPFMQAGGAENRIRTLLQALIKRPDIDEVHYMFIGAEAAHNIQAQGKFHLWQVRTGHTKNVTKTIIDKYNIDIVQLHNNQLIGTEGIKYAQKVGIPTVWVMHDFWTICPQRFMTRPFNAEAYPLCHKINPYECIKDCVGFYECDLTRKQREVVQNCDVGIVPSKRAREIFEMNNFMNGKLEIIEPWIDLTAFYPDPNVPKKPYQIFFAGNFIPHKGIKVLLRAFSLVNKRLPMTVLIAQGDTRKLNETIQFAKANKLLNLNLIEFVPPDRLRILYNESAITIFPSIWEETIGLIWIESLACGTPVICSKIGGIPELLKYGGELFEPRNHVELAEKIVDMLLSPSKQVKLGQEGHAYVTQAFKPERGATDFAKLYYGLDLKRGEKKVG